MMTHAEREDDAVLSFSSLVSLFLHGLLFLLIPFQAAQVFIPQEHVFITRFTQFSPVESFSSYSGDQKIFSDYTTGRPELTTGSASDAGAQITRGEMTTPRGPQDLNRQIYVPPAGSNLPRFTSRIAPRPEQMLPLNDAIVTTRRPEDLRSDAAAPATTRALPAAVGPNGELLASANELVAGRVTGEADRAARYSGVASDERNFFTAPASGSNAAEGEGPSSPTGRPGSSRTPSDAVAASGVATGTERSSTPSASPQSSGPTTSNRPVPTAVGINPPEFEAQALSASPRRLRQSPKPIMPDWVEEAGHDYFVDFRIRVDESGRVINAVVYRTSGQPELDQIAKRSVLQWLYEPRSGQEDDFIVRVNFITN